MSFLRRIFRPRGSEPGLSGSPQRRGGLTAVRSLCEEVLAAALLATKPINDGWAEATGEQPMSTKSNCVVRSEFIWFFLHVVSRTAYSQGGARARDAISDVVPRVVLQAVMDSSFDASNVKPGFDAESWRRRMIDDSIAAYEEADAEYGSKKLFGASLGENIASPLECPTALARLGERIAESTGFDSVGLSLLVAGSVVDSLAAHPLPRFVNGACRELGIATPGG